MGLLRFMLAFAVFNAHAALPLGFSLLAGSTAVHCFFVISGYYMAMVLTEKYGRGGAAYYEFVSNRALRLMPSYLVVALLTLLAGALFSVTRMAALPPVAAHDALAGQGMPWWIAAASAVSQFTLLGLDIWSFGQWNAAQGLHAVTPAVGVEGSLQSLLLVPTAWSLSVEMYFYLAAPFIVAWRLRSLWLLLLASVLCRVLLAWVFELRTDPWSYRFAPSEMAFFIAGVLAWRLSVGAGRRAGRWMILMGACGALLGLLEVLGIHTPGMGLHKWARVPLFALLCAGVPLLFEATRRWRWDRYIGELSYPLYISHLLVIWCLAALGLDPGDAAGRVTLIVAAIAAAVALQRWVDAPVDRYRQRRLSRPARGAAAVPATA